MRSNKTARVGTAVDFDSGLIILVALDQAMEIYGYSNSNEISSMNRTLKYHPLYFLALGFSGQDAFGTKQQ